MPSTLDAMRRSLFTAVLSDCLDAVGRRNQAMPSRIRPLDESVVMAGRARTASLIETGFVPGGVNPYALEIALVDSLRPGDIPVFACANSLQVAPWGELLSTAAQVRGSAGALMDGCVRDVKAIRAMGYPVSWRHRAARHQGPRPRVVVGRRPVIVAGVAVSPGDLVFGDADGVVVIPQDVEDRCCGWPSRGRGRAHDAFGTATRRQARRRVRAARDPVEPSGVAGCGRAAAAQAFHALRQGGHHLATFGIGIGAPATDLVPGAAAAQAPAGLRIEHTDIDAGGRDGHGLP